MFNILVVDDNQPVLDQVKQYFSGSQYAVTTAVNGLDGLDKIQKSVFDLVIIDHLMPIMNGIQLCKNIKQIDSLSKTPVIFMTTQEVSSVEFHDSTEIFDVILAKPLEEEILISNVEQLLNINCQAQSV